MFLDRYPLIISYNNCYSEFIVSHTYLTSYILEKNLQHHCARKKSAGAYALTPLRLNEMNQRFSAASLKDRSRISTSIENSWSSEHWSHYRVLSRAISLKGTRICLEYFEATRARDFVMNFDWECYNIVVEINLHEKKIHFTIILERI